MCCLRGGYVYSRGYVYCFYQMFQGLCLFKGVPIFRTLEQEVKSGCCQQKRACWCRLGPCACALRGRFPKFETGLNVCFTTISNHFFANYMNIFHKPERVGKQPFISLKFWESPSIKNFDDPTTKYRYFAVFEKLCTNYAYIKTRIEFGFLNLFYSHDWY